MPHITEGELHAYLDGALAAIDPDAEERLTAHLVRCADCRARLERERAVHDRSAVLLAAALPEPVEAPPFERIRERAGGAGTGMSRPSGRLAWAASIVVALGAGWMGHALLGGSGESIPGARLASEAASPQVRNTLADAVDTVGTTSAEGAATDARAGETRSNEAADADVAERPADPTTRDETGRDRARRQEVAGAGVADAPAAEPAEEGAERRLAVGERAEAETLRITPQAAETRPSVVGAVEDVAERSEAFAGAAWRSATVEEAEAWVGRPLLAVPDLPVDGIAVADVEGLRLARIHQTLGDGAPLELVLERPSAAFVDRERAAARSAAQSPRPDELTVAETLVEDDAVAAFWRRVGLVGPAEEPGGLHGVRAVIDGAWVTLAAPVASDSLRAIVSRVQRLEGP